MVLGGFRSFLVLVLTQNEEHADRCTFHEMFTCVVAGYFELSWVCDCHKEMISYVFLLFF